MRRPGARHTIAMTPYLGALLLALAWRPAGAAQEVDFSCVKEWVRGKPQLYDQYKEYDVILHNQCPGAVYWNLCIERVDPATHRVIETHTPSGFIEAEAKSRVNLQLRKGPPEMGENRRFQELYVGDGYALQPPAAARCVAAECESYKHEWRTRLSENGKTWQAARDALEARLQAECPASAWGRTAETEACEAELLRSSQPELDEYAAEEQRLREKLRTAGGPGCELHGGDPATQ